MSERQAGLYWVKAYEDGIWEGLHWHGKWWADCSIGYEPPVVGPRIPTPDESAMVACACGDQFPPDSYGAGFMAANGGVCENCAMTEGGGDA